MDIESKCLHGTWDSCSAVSHIMRSAPSEIFFNNKKQGISYLITALNLSSGYGFCYFFFAFVKHFEYVTKQRFRSSLEFKM